MTKPLKVLKERIEEVIAIDGTSVVTLCDDTKATVTWFGKASALANDWQPNISGAKLLRNYLNDCSVVELDDGRRIPLCNIKEISKVVEVERKVKYRVYRVRDWNMLPFGTSYWKEEKIK